MNVEKLTRLRDYLLLVPEERFQYKLFFCNKETYPLSIRESLKGNFYAANAEGYAAILFLFQVILRLGTEERLSDVLLPEDRRPKMSSPFSGERLSAVIQHLLGLSDDERTFLFDDENERANKSDAILRLNHLIEGKGVLNYDWSKESYSGE